MNPYAIIAVLLAFAAAGAGGFRLGIDHQKAQEVEKRELVAEAVDAANNASAAVLASLRPKFTTIQNKVQHEVETHTIYTDCKLSPDGMLLANQALAGAKPASESKLPQADATGK